MSDPATVDSIIAWCGRKPVSPLPFLAIHLHETAGGDLDTVIEMSDGTRFRTFTPGDKGLRSDGTLGYQSWGPFHVYAKVHGPFLPDNTPDWEAAIRKWHDVDTTMDYLWNDRWSYFWDKRRGFYTFPTMPANLPPLPDSRTTYSKAVEWLNRYAKDMQGSLDWTEEQADTAYAAALVAIEDHIQRHAAPPLPEPDTRITVDELLAGYRLAQHGLDELDGELDMLVIQAQQSFHNLREQIAAHRDGIQRVIDRAKDGVKM